MEKEKPVRTVKDVFDHAHEIDSPAERKAYLDRTCAGAPELRQKVEALLLAYDEAGSSFLAKPAAGLPDTGPYQAARATPVSSPGPLPKAVDHRAVNEGPGTPPGALTQTLPPSLPKRTAAAVTLDLPAGDTAPQRPAAAGTRSKPPASAQLSADSPVAPDIPERIGRFVIRRPLGEGAFGRVYEAHDPQLDRAVALKVAKPELMHSPRRVQRFLREAKAAANLRHPHIVPVFDSGSDGRHFYIASALIPGRSLDKHLEELPKGQLLEMRRAVQIVRRLAEALGYAHQRKVVHRDVKPANVMLDDGGEPLLMDFGLAAREDGGEKLTQEGAKGVGTPAYMAPEQGAGEAVAASDQYSLGSTLYELLTGQTPFAGPPELQLYLHQAEEAPHPRKSNRTVPLDLDTICLKCLEKEPAKRYADCQALADDLRRWLDGETVTARRPGSLERLGKWARRRPAAAGFVALLMLGVVGLTFGIVEVNRARGREAIETQKAVRAKNEAEKANNETTAALKVSEGMIQVIARNSLTLGSREKGKLIELLRQYGQTRPEQGDTQEERSWAAEAQLRLANNFAFIKERDEAAKCYRKAISLYAGLVDDFDSVVVYREQLARSNYNLGILLQQLGKQGEAEEAYDRAIHLHEQLATEFPTEIDYRRELADDYNNLGALLRDRSELPKAEKAFRQAIAMGEKLVVADPDHRINLAANYHNLGNAVRDQGNSEAALAWYGKAIQLLSRLTPPSDDVNLLLRNAFWDRANALGQRGKHAEASQDWQRALVLEANGPAQGHLQLFLEASKMEVKLKAENQPAAALLYAAAVLHAQATAAAKLEDEVQLERQFSKRTLVLLNQAMAAGWFRDPARIAQLKADKTFDSLPAADIKPFIASLEAGRDTNDPPDKK